MVTTQQKGTCSTKKRVIKHSAEALQRISEKEEARKRDRAKNDLDCISLCREIISDDFSLKSKPQKDLVKKIDDHFDRHSYFLKRNAKDIIKRIASGTEEGDELASLFSVKPHRQSISQQDFRKLTTKLVDRHSNWYFDDLQSVGRIEGKVYLNDNGVFENQRQADREESSQQKDVDFSIYTYEGGGYTKGSAKKTFHIFHKSITAQGGSQDGEFSELLGFVKKACLNDNKNIFSIVAYEGSHFTKKKLNKIEGLITSDRVAAIQSLDCEALENYISDNE